MKIQELHIQNYKSLVDLKIIEPNPFTVFAGSNGAGKSNIFEAIELTFLTKYIDFTYSKRLFGNEEEIKSKISNSDIVSIKFMLPISGFGFEYIYNLDRKSEEEFLFKGKSIGNPEEYNKYLVKHNLHGKDVNIMQSDFSRISINTIKKVFDFTDDDLRLNTKASNLEKVLKRILKDENKREDICEWLDLLVPGFEKIEIVSEPLSGTDSLIIYEKGTKKPYTKNLLSDGSYNILALLTTVYQSDEPQFLCIEEPENGLNPKVQKELVNLFRQKCEEEGHYIWINTHSQTIVNQLTTKELILVNKVDGATQIKQLQSFDTSGLPMDEAWLTNTLGGGVPW